MPRILNKTILYGVYVHWEGILVVNPETPAAVYELRSRFIQVQAVRLLYANTDY